MECFNLCFWFGQHQSYWEFVPNYLKGTGNRLKVVTREVVGDCQVWFVIDPFNFQGESFFLVSCSLARRGQTREESVEHLLRGIGKFGQNS